MRILLVGATGLIGAQVLARLTVEGHEVVAVTRGAEWERRDIAGVRWVKLDLRSARTPEAWQPLLAGIDAVINCAGVLQDSPRDSTEAVHLQGPAALYQACVRQGVRRIVHVSAIGIDRETPTTFSRTKRRGEGVLTSLDLDWVILRPSVVVGRRAYGGSALFRGLAALPVLPEIAGAGRLQIVQLDDLVTTILFFIRPDAPARNAFDVAGPEPLTLPDVVATYRRWLGWRPAARMVLPRPLMSLMFFLGDVAGAFGWRPPIRTTGALEILRGAVGDPGPWMAVTGLVPKSLGAALAEEPASIQERWFARLYLLKPLLISVFAAFWIATGLISLGPGWEEGMSLMKAGNAEAIAPYAIVAGALADIAIGFGIVVRKTSRLALYAALALSLTYVVVGTLLVPALWSDPLGPMLKIWPILALNLAVLAILDER